MPSVVLDQYEFLFSDGLGGPGAVLERNVSCNVAASQTTGRRITAEGTHVDVSVATGSLVLPQINDATTSFMVFNDTANSLNLYACPPPTGVTVADTINALANNTAFPITAGSACLVMRGGATRIGQRGVSVANPKNWRATLLT